MGGGKIDCYFDCVSPYSYFAFDYLVKNRKALESHGVEVEFHPMFLGGIMGGSGNKPPWTVEAKAKYLRYDNARAKHYFNLPNTTRPSVFPIQTLLPQRTLAFIKSTHPRAHYEAAMRSLWVALWEQDTDISDPARLEEVLKLAFSEAEAEEAVKAGGEGRWKEVLAENTRRALERGAFGAPWFWVRNSKGEEEEPFFGSDRWHFMWEFLGIPWEDVRIKEKL